jgi:hypothetical protein
MLVGPRLRRRRHLLWHWLRRECEWPVNHFFLYGGRRPLIIACSCGEVFGSSTPPPVPPPEGLPVMRIWARLRRQLHTLWQSMLVGPRLRRRGHMLWHWLRREPQWPVNDLFLHGRRDGVAASRPETAPRPLMIIACSCGEVFWTSTPPPAPQGEAT